MKRLLFAGLLIGCMGMLPEALKAQDTTTAGEDIKRAAKKTGKAIEKGAKKVANKSAELASKGRAEVVDKVFEGKYGPDGQKIYINHESKYYWVDKKGKRHFVAADELKEEKEG